MAKTIKVHITGECTVYRNDKWGYPVYSAKLSSNIDGQWRYDYIQLKFPRSEELKNFTEIKINDGFFSFYSKRDGTTEKCIIVTSYDILNETVGNIDIPTNDIVNSDDDFDLPF